MNKRVLMPGPALLKGNKREQWSRFPPSQGTRKLIFKGHTSLDLDGCALVFSIALRVECSFCPKRSLIGFIRACAPGRCTRLIITHLA